MPVPRNLYTINHDNIFYHFRCNSFQTGYKRKGFLGIVGGLTTLLYILFAHTVNLSRAFTCCII